MDQLNSMRMFVAIADRNSFKAAADELDISPSVISKHISALESHLGIKLLERNTRHVALTQIGESYLVNCRNILDEVNRFEANLTDRIGHLKGVLRINAPPGFGHRHIAPHLPLFIEQHPDMIIDITTANNNSNNMLFEVDLHIKISEAEVPNDCEMTILAPNRRKLVGSPAYIEKRGMPRTISDLSGHQLIMLESTHHNHGWHFKTVDNRTETFRANGSVRMDNGDSMLRTVLNDGGLAMLPTYIVGRHIQSGALVTVLDAQLDESTPVHALWRGNNHRWPKIKAMVEFLRSVYGETPYWDDDSAAGSPAALRASK